MVAVQLSGNYSPVSQWRKNHWEKKKNFIKLTFGKKIDSEKRNQRNLFESYIVTIFEELVFMYWWNDETRRGFGLSSCAARTVVVWASFRWSDDTAHRHRLVNWEKISAASFVDANWDYKVCRSKFATLSLGRSWTRPGGRRGVIALRAVRHRGVTCDYASNKNVINQSE